MECNAIGITGGEEDGVDNTGVDNAALYTQPEDIWEVYEALSQVPHGVACLLDLLVDQSYFVFRYPPTSVLQPHLETYMACTNLEMLNCNPPYLENTRHMSRKNWVDQRRNLCKLNTPWSSQLMDFLLTGIHMLQKFPASLCSTADLARRRRKSVQPSKMVS